MKELSFKLDDFEGPLDLLLHLISSHKINILEVEISELLRQYMEYIEESKENDLEIKSEFLEMAARLVHIKSVSMLPRNEDEAENLRSQLIVELMEYSLCKLAASLLSELSSIHKTYVRNPLEIQPDKEYRLTHSKRLLLEAIIASTGRAVRKKEDNNVHSFNPIVRRVEVTVGSRVVHLLRRFYENKNQRFNSLFEDQEDRSGMVATFLAVLELIKAGRIIVSDDGDSVSYIKDSFSKEDLVTDEYI